MCKKATNDSRIYPHFPTPEKLTSQDKPTKALITTNATSLHSQLADQIREMIYSRELVSGEKILSEHKLMNRFGISRGTVRHAIETLVNEGLLLRVHGKGTYVAEEGLS
ncbi:MAG: GntR family transcriptional regulator, partial [Lancefieldella sp.]